MEFRDRDVEAMADRLARGFFDGDLVAIADRGREAIVFDDELADLLGGRVDVYRIDRDGSVSRKETGH